MVVTFEYEPMQKVITIHGIVCWIVCCQYRDGIVTYLIEDSRANEYWYPENWLQSWTQVREDRLKVEFFKSNEG